MLHADQFVHMIAVLFVCLVYGDERVTPFGLCNLRLGCKLMLQRRCELDVATVFVLFRQLVVESSSFIMGYISKTYGWMYGVFFFDWVIM